MVEMMELLRKDAQGALEHLEMFTDSGFYTLENNHVRVICHALRAFMKSAPSYQEGLGRSHFDKEGCDPPQWYGPTGE